MLLVDGVRLALDAAHLLELGLQRRHLLLQQLGLKPLLRRRAVLLRVGGALHLHPNVARALAEQPQLVPPPLVRRLEPLELRRELRRLVVEARNLGLLRLRLGVLHLLGGDLHLALAHGAARRRVVELAPRLDHRLRLLPLEEREERLVVLERLEERLEERRLPEPRLADDHQPERLLRRLAARHRLLHRVVVRVAHRRPRLRLRRLHRAVLLTERPIRRELVARRRVVQVVDRPPAAVLPLLGHRIVAPRGRLHRSRKFVHCVRYFSRPISRRRDERSARVDLDLEIDVGELGQALRGSAWRQKPHSSRPPQI